MSNACVLDASVVLAVLRDEPCAGDVEALLETGMISAVNLSEVVAKLQEGGAPEARIDANLARMNLNIASFDEAQAIAAGKLRAATRHLGLSLGDRACLALATVTGATAVTMDRSWAELDLTVAIRVARG